MKTDVELLKLLLQELEDGTYKRYRVKGLCILINFISGITRAESCILTKIIIDNEPPKWCKYIFDTTYYWHPRRIKPRIRFVKRLIKKYQ